MNILITGGKGFIGSYLAEMLMQSGHDVATFDAHLNFTNNLEYFHRMMKVRSKYFKFKPSKEYKSDIRDIESLHKACKDFKPEIIVHLAGLPMARPPENHAGMMLPINMQGTLNVLEVFESCPSARRIIYTSSSMAYGHFTAQPQPEHSILSPVNAYGATKAAGEYFVKLSKKEWIIIRPTSVYGFTDCANRVTQLLIDAAVAGKSAWVVKGEALDFSYVRDVAVGFATCVTSPSAVYEIFNISRGHSRDASEFAEILKHYFPAFKYEIRNPNNTQVWRGSMDNAHAKKILGYRAQYGIEEGIKETLELMKEYKQLSG